MCLNTSAVEAVKKKKEKGPGNGRTAADGRGRPPRNELWFIARLPLYVCAAERQREGGRDARERVAAETARARALLHAPMGERTRDNQHVFVL